MPGKTSRKKVRVGKNRAVAPRGDAALRKHLVNLLTSAEAHLSFDDAVKGFAPEMRGVRPPGAAHTAWQLLEHLRICQWDILEFSRNPKHVSPAFPDGLWPATDTPPDEAAWKKSLSAFHADLRALAKLVADPKCDLLARIRHPEAKAHHTLLREALLVADHNAYHIGQLVLLRRLLTANMA